MGRLDTTSLLRQLSRLHSERGRGILALDGFQSAAVLVPILLEADGPEILLTKRTDDVETHKGQISFPGGVSDAADADIVHTALREAEEELGIEPSLVEVKGTLDDLATPTGFIITPVVGLLSTLPVLHPNPQEVAEAFTVPLEFFRDPGNGRTELRYFLGEKRHIWFYQRGDHTIWGATAMIIRSLLERLELL